MSINQQKISAAVSALAIGAIFFIAALALQVDQKYSEFIVGNTTWHGGSKVQDLIVWPLFIITSFISFSVLLKTTLKLQEDHGSRVADSFSTQLVLWSLPFYANFASVFLGGSIDRKTVLLSALGIVSLGVIGLFKRKNTQTPDPSLWSLFLLLALLISLIPIEISVLLSKLPLEWIGNLAIKRFNVVSNILVITGFIAAIGLLTLSDRASIKNPRTLIFFAQIGLPVFFLTLLPAKIIQPSGELFAYETTTQFKTLLLLLVGYGIYDIVKRFWNNYHDPDWKQAFSPFAFFALAIALRLGHTTPPHISPDDYHFGEHLLGWWSYMKGFIPYVDYIPAHGLVENDLTSMFSHLFYDGTAASSIEAGRLVFAMLGLFAFMSIYYFTGSIVLAFATMLLLGGRLGWLFFVPFICLWLNVSLREQPGKWLAVWIVSAPVVVLAIPPQGLLLVVAFGILALKMAWDQILFGDRKSWQHLALVSVLVLIIFLATPLFSMLFGAVRYVIENGFVNQLAYGIPWVHSLHTEHKAGFLLEIVRMSWVAALFFFLYVIHTHWKSFKDSRSFFYPALIFFCFTLLLIPYSMGRIDAAHISRPGLVSIFSWAVLFPFLAWSLFRSESRALILLSSVFISALLGYGATSFSGLPSVAAQIIPSPPLQDSAAAGLPNVGRAHIDSAQWDRLTRLNTLLEQRLNKDETYLDLTSRNAHYFYLNRSPAMPVTAPYNLVQINQQKRAIETLSATPPKLALLMADNIIHDGGGLALRNPYLYRFVMDHYVPRFENGFIVGYLKPTVKSKPGTVISAEIKEVINTNVATRADHPSPLIVLSDPVLAPLLNVGDTIRFNDGTSAVIENVQAEENAIELNRAPASHTTISDGNFIDIVVPPGVYREYIASLFHRASPIPDLQKIPFSWGRSASSLNEKMFSPVNLSELAPSGPQFSNSDGAYVVKEDDSQLTLDLSALGISGHSAGLLRFDFHCLDRRFEPKMQVAWWGDEQTTPKTTASIKFIPENGTLIVPLDASPWWVGLSHIKGLQFSLEKTSACRKFSLDNISLYQR